MTTTGEEVMPVRKEQNTFHSVQPVQVQPEAQTQTEEEEKEPENTDIYELNEDEEEQEEGEQEEEEEENEIKTILDRYTETEEEYIQQRKNSMLVLSMAFLGVAVSPALISVFNTPDSNTYINKYDPAENKSIYSFN
jgi:flagellar biosynthesis GTPase FlhF